MTEAPLSAEDFARSGIVSRETISRLELYAALLIKWQKAINLVGKDTLPDLWRRHMLDSAQLAPLIPAVAHDGGRRTLVDFGSGAGFPGMVLAIMAADEGRQWDVHLVESDSRKCAFLSTVARETKTTVKIHAVRIESMTVIPAHTVTARALAPLDKLLGYAESFLQQGTECLFLKGINVADELTAAHKSWNMQIEQLPSRSGPAGSLLHIREISRVRSRT
ncbi:MAG TPA: 16S rRNA (guanine(527)-N(7))-methyltransferase RsmG [Alphaproteobacteria bacterium]|nr:16S rRNA (guanine(527)-N(7))-methyltransferase RsmG [Alphaproteobacteria bacterium]